MLKAEHKELDIRIKAEPNTKQREVELSIEVVAKVGYMCLYSEVAEKVEQVDLYVSNLLAFLEDSRVEAMVKHIEVAGKLDIQNLEMLDS
jgi:hypothetical protein